MRGNIMDRVIWTDAEAYMGIGILVQSLCRVRKEINKGVNYG